MSNGSAALHQVQVVNEQASFSCQSGLSLLVGMERQHVGASMTRYIPAGCRGGGCGVCRVRILSGTYTSKKMSIKHVTPEEREQGVALACRVFPEGNMCIEVLERSEA